MTTVGIAEDVVGLRGTNIILFRRPLRDQWRVDRDSCDAVVERLVRIGYELENRWNIETRLNSYLQDLEFFYPGSIPSAWFGLVEALNGKEDPLPGESLSALGEPSYERYELRRHRRVLHDDRVSLREIEMICEEHGLRRQDIALRPLVGTTENAASAKWHYGLWGVYRGNHHTHAEMVAIYGHRKGGFGEDCWIPINDDDRSYWAPSIRDFSRIGCAITGRTLFEWGQPSEDPNHLTQDLFADLCPIVRSAGEMDIVTLAPEPYDRPILKLI